jgi:UDP-glucose 6-dehydrogenase
VAVWGLAYKADTLSIRNSPSIELIKALGVVPVQAYDPKVVLKDSGLPCRFLTSAPRGSGW